MPGVGKTLQNTITTAATATIPLTQTTNAPPASVTDSTPLNSSEQQNLSTNNSATLETYIQQHPSEFEFIDDPDNPGKQLQVRKQGLPPLPGTFGSVPTPTNPDSVGLLPLPNRLHDYPSYIYGLSWHLLSDTQYNTVVNTQTYVPTNVLVASAGRYNTTNFVRNEFFTDDFYFENLDIVTVIAPNDNSRNTNAIDLSFTLIEPYGFTLVERLLKAADAVKSQNYLDMPYVLQIDFFAIDDAGNIKGSIDELRKIIPIKLYAMDIGVSVRGAEYSIKASPFNHSAFDSTSVTTPANFEVVASTVANFFISDADNQTTEQANLAVQRETAQTATPTNPANGGIFTVKSYGTAINAWYKALKDTNKIKVNDIYKFQFDDEIGKASFTSFNKATPKETPMNDKSTDSQVKIAKANQGQNQGTYDPTKALFQINSGTTIEKLLEYVIRNSDYIQNQLAVPESPDYAQKKEELKNKPLFWFKIVPTVRLLDFDTRKNIWAREITYTVKKYTMYNIRSDVGPQGVQLFPAKNYNYIYTGKNDDVLNFDIKFNALYYNQVTAYRDNLAGLTPSADSAADDNQTTNTQAYTGPEQAGNAQYNAVMPLVMKPQVQNSRAVATGGATTAKEVASVDLADSLMTNSQADMLNLKLSILGDPDYIKQDDVFFGPISSSQIVTKPSSDPRLLPGNGSLAMDDGCIYAQVLFRTPVDIDESTGLMKYDSKYQHSLFSGLYQVLQVTSSFKVGEFTQELELIRMPRQSAFDYTEANQNSQSDNRKESAQKLQTSPGIQPSAPTVSLPAANNGANTTADAADTGNTTEGQEQAVAQAQTTETATSNQLATDLASINANAPVVDITAQNEPQAVVPNFSPISVNGNRVPGQASITG